MSGWTACYMGHVLTERRHGPVVDAQVTPGTGKAKREAVLQMVARLPQRHRVAVGADEAYDTHDFVLRDSKNTPMPRSTRVGGGSASDARTTRHPGYALIQGDVFATPGTCWKRQHEGLLDRKEITQSAHESILEPVVKAPSLTRGDHGMDRCLKSCPIGLVVWTDVT